MSRPNLKPQERIIIALDFPERQKALALAKSLTQSPKGRVSTFKIGPVLFLEIGPEGLREFAELGASIFLDLKFHDIPSTVEKSLVHLPDLGVSMFTVHALGGLDMMKGAVSRVREEYAKKGASPPLVLAVTVLTSHGDETLGELGIGGGTSDTVLRLAELADKAGVDGLVASGRESELLRKNFGDRFTLVVPGIRLGSDEHDQKRVTTPRDAVLSGADYLVIGRAVTESPSPMDVVENIINSLKEV